LFFWTLGAHDGREVSESKKRNYIELRPSPLANSFDGRYNRALALKGGNIRPVDQVARPAAATGRCVNGVQLS
jgi:hypothetical protein